MRDLDREIRLLIGRFGGARARPLTLRQQQRLAREAQAGNKQAGAKLVESCLGLVVAVATEHASGETVADMVQNGAVEMLERLYGRPNKRDPEREVTRYDPDRGVKFWTFARPYVLAAIRDTFERPSTVPLPEDEYDVPDPLRQDGPEDADLAIKCATHSGSKGGRKIRRRAYPKPIPTGFHAYRGPDFLPRQVRLCVPGFMARSELNSSLGPPDRPPTRLHL